MQLGTKMIEIPKEYVWRLFKMNTCNVYLRCDMCCRGKAPGRADGGQSSARWPGEAQGSAWPEAAGASKWNHKRLTEASQVPASSRQTQEASPGKEGTIQGSSGRTGMFPRCWAAAWQVLELSENKTEGKTPMTRLTEITLIWWDVKKLYIKKKSNIILNSSAVYRLKLIY